MTGYARAVVGGAVVAGSLVRLACRRHLEDVVHQEARGLRFDAAHVAKVTAAFRLFRHSKGEWAGTPLLLEPWQVFIVGNLVGWKSRATGLRRFRTAYIEIARKNGKSTLAAALGILFAFYDGEPGAEVYAAATKRDQAKIVWGEAKRMVLRSAELRQTITALAGNLHDPETGSKFEPLGADSDSMDGLNIHVAIVDELHAHKTRDVWDVLETATSARRQALMLAITTAGFNRDSVCWSQRDYGRRVLEGVLPDDSVFTYIATLDEGDDWQDPAVWPKSNPNLGVSVKLEDLVRKCTRAVAMPSGQNGFKRLHLNLWTQQQERWIDPVQWQANQADVTDAELRRMPCVAGLDLGQTDDFSAFVRIWRLPDGRIVPRVRYWIPRTALETYPDRPYPDWVSRADLHVHEGDTVSYETIRKEILALCQAAGVRRLGYDKRFAEEMAQWLMDQGVECVEMPQGFGLTAGLHEIARLLAEGQLAHDGDPVLQWMADNAVVKHGDQGQMKLIKPQGSGERVAKKIDALIALAQALHPAILAAASSDGPKVWVF